MRLLSFDVGIYNMAYAALTVPDTADVVTEKSLETKIDDWGILCMRDAADKKTPDMTTLTERLIALLFEKFGDLEPFDIVLIENQPCMKNPTMKSIQMVLFSFFMMRNHMEASQTQVKFVSASNKLKVTHKPDTSAIKTSSKYAMNKKLVVEYTKHYLDLTTEINGHWMPVFKSTKKSDDLADAYGQAIHYIENNMK